jgi:hypothetical protein
MGRGKQCSLTCHTPLTKFVGTDSDHNDEIIFIVCVHTVHLCTDLQPLSCYRRICVVTGRGGSARRRPRGNWPWNRTNQLDQFTTRELQEQEVRSHRAGDYGFSIDEEQRRGQTGLLNKLREQVC